jgi:hypothetical protein
MVMSSTTCSTTPSPFPNPWKECEKYPRIVEKIVAEEIDGEIRWMGRKDEEVLQYYEYDLENSKRFKPELVDRYETYIWALKMSMRFIKGDLFLGYVVAGDRPFELWIDGKTINTMKLRVVDVVKFVATQWNACIKHSNVCTCDCLKPEAYCQLGVFVVAPADIDIAAKALLASAIITTEIGVDIGEVLQKLKGKD